MPDYLSMDPNILFSLANMRLRNDCRNTLALAHELGVDNELLLQRLAEGGYRYVTELNQFRPAPPDSATDSNSAVDI